MSKFQRTVLVDCAALGHYVKHSMRYLTNDGTTTGVIYGFLGLIKEAAEIMKPRQFVFAWDSVKSHRKRIYPEYKSNRAPSEKTEEERHEDNIMREQLKILRTDIIPALGFQNSFLTTGFEADDIIAACAISLPGKVFIMSRDNDLFQLLNQHVCMWDFQKKRYFTADDFTDKWRIEPNEWRQVKCMAGCTGDGIGNIPGIKESTAIKFMKGELPQFNKNKTPNKKYQAIKDHPHIIARNRPLVCLPFRHGKIVTPRYVVKRDQVSISAFWEMCEKYDFNSYLKDIEEWTELLNMT